MITVEISDAYERGLLGAERSAAFAGRQDPGLAQLLPNPRQSGQGAVSYTHLTLPTTD